MGYHGNEDRQGSVPDFSVVRWRHVTTPFLLSPIKRHGGETLQSNRIEKVRHHACTNVDPAALTNRRIDIVTLVPPLTT